LFEKLYQTLDKRFKKCVLYFFGLFMAWTIFSV